MGQAIQPENRGVVDQLNASYNRNVNPSLEVPIHWQYYTWKITGTVGGIELYKDAVPVVLYDNAEKTFRHIAKLPIGTEVKLNHHWQISGRLFYSHKVDLEGEEVYGWIEGTFIERDNEKSFKPKPRKYKRNR